MVISTLKLAKLDENGILSVELQDILKALESYGHELRWSILWIRGTPRAESPQYEPVVFAQETGLVTDWDGLIEVGNQFLQIEDAWIVGTMPTSPLPIRQHEMDSTYLIVIEAVDSTYWLISGDNELMMHQLAHRLGSSSRSD